MKRPTAPVTHVAKQNLNAAVQQREHEPHIARKPIELSNFAFCFLQAANAASSCGRFARLPLSTSVNRVNAADGAPYCHQRLSIHQVEGNKDKPVVNKITHIIVDPEHYPDKNA